jgi:hypothetical protein
VLLGLSLAATGCEGSECAEGFVELDGRCFNPDGPCDVQCGPHEVCDITVVPNVCNCAAGFAGDPCVWIGVVAEPSFQSDSTDGAWREQGGFVNGGGEGEIRPAAICTAGVLSQVIEMPTFEAGGPLVADVVYRAAFVEGLAVGFNDSWTRLPSTGDAYEERTFCLGEAAYWRPEPDAPPSIPAPLGGPVLIRLSASERLENLCNAGVESGTIRIDDFNIRPLEKGDEPCPQPADPPLRPGTINPDANGGEGGWSFECAPTGCVNGGFVPDLDSGRDSVAQISRPEGEDYLARMTTRVSVPLPVDGRAPALSFWWKGSNERLFPVEIGTFGGFDDGDPPKPRRARSLDTLVGRGGGRSQVYCLPEWTYGAVVDLSFALPSDGVTDAAVLAVDQVRITNDSSCSLVDDLLGFESEGTSWAGSTLRSIDQRVSIISADGLGAPTDSLLELSYALEPDPVSQDAQLGIEAFVKVLEADEGGGPAVEFYAGAEGDVTADVRWTVGASCAAFGDEACGCTGEVVVSTEAWEPNVACLPQSWSGRWYRFGLQVLPQEEGGGTGGRSRILFDGIRSTTSASCDCP